MLIYKNKKYATTTNFQYECDRALDCQITFKRPDSKQKFLELYGQREDLFLSSKIVTVPPKSSRAFLPRSKTVIERMRSDGIIPKQNIIINIRKQFAFGSICVLINEFAL